MEEQVKELIITPNEAQVLEICMRVPSIDTRLYRELLLLIGHCLVKEKDVVLSVSDEELWMIREVINPLMLKDGFDLIKKIYTLLLDEQPNLPNKEMLAELKTVWERKDADRSTAESNTEYEAQG